MTATRAVAVPELLHLVLTGSHFRHSQVCAKTPEKAGLGEKEDCPQSLRLFLVVPGHLHGRVHRLWTEKG